MKSLNFLRSITRAVNPVSNTTPSVRNGQASRFLGAAAGSQNAPGNVGITIPAPLTSGSMRGASSRLVAGITNPSNGTTSPGNHGAGRQDTSIAGRSGATTRQGNATSSSGILKREGGVSASGHSRVSFSGVVRTRSVEPRDRRPIACSWSGLSPEQRRQAARGVKNEHLSETQVNTLINKKSSSFYGRMVRQRQLSQTTQCIGDTVDSSGARASNPTSPIPIPRPFVRMTPGPSLQVSGQSVSPPPIPRARYVTAQPQARNSSRGSNDCPGDPASSSNTAPSPLASKKNYLDI